MAVKKCDTGFFDPDLRMCVQEINSGKKNPTVEIDWCKTINEKNLTKA